ncbi:hypothetical protein B0H13DRAFT_1873720 [Mycena leptocephala]|nr:hypothetical protein B0H13DRAFT_1873720 [Mycena leptocephala]
MVQSLTLRPAHPVQNQRIATAACAAHASAEEIDCFARLLTTSPRRKVEFLPVLFAMLDPSRIPTTEQLDPCSADTLCIVRAALLSICMIFGLKIRPEVGADLWLRIWRWVEFWWTFRDFLGELMESPSEEQLCVGLVIFSDQMCLYPPNSALITSTPGFQVFVVRAWACLLQREDITQNVSKTALFVVHEFLTCGTVFLHDRIEGAGGSIDDLAALAMMHLDLVSTTGDAPLSSDEIWLLQLVLDIVLVTDGMGQDDASDVEASNLLNQDKPDQSPSPLCSALTSPAFVKTLTIIARTICQQATPDDGQIASKCLGLLVSVFKMARRHDMLRISVRHGLVLTILACAQQPDSGSMHDTLRTLLSDILTPSSVHYYALADLATAYFAAAKSIGPEAFCRADVFEAWARFTQAVHSRLGVFRSFDSNNCISRGACNNVECGIVLEKSRLKRCSGCRELFYCSPRCQSLDWHHGHRESCPWHLIHRTNSELTHTSRERAFLRALLHHDYESARTGLYTVLVNAWATEPDAAFYTMYDYRSGGVTVSMHRIKAGRTEGQGNSEHWADLLVRRSRSGGRMALHVMRVREGGGERDWVIPLRRMTSQVPDALKRIAACLGSLDPAQVEEQISSVVRSELMGDIH